MRSAQLSTIVIGGFCSLAFAVSANAASVTATGCLEKGAEKGEFTLSHATGGGAEELELVPDKGVDLNAHLGHKVEVTGEAASEMSEKNSKGEKERPHPHLKVKSLKHIAAQCP
jgi:hypothetical protein